MKPILSVIVLSFNTKDYLHRCLTSIFSSKRIDMKDLEVIVVDNNSSDDSVEMVNKYFTQVKLIKNDKNVGFSAGNNIGIKKSKGKLVLLVNSDVEVNPDTLSKMMEFVNQRPELGAATCRLNLADGRIDPACHRGFPTPWAAFSYLSGLEKSFPRSKTFSGYHQGFKDLSTPHEVDVISGAFFLIPKAVIEKVGLMDEQFFMYGEDIDWCYRINQTGYKIMFNPLAVAVHHKRQSGRARKSEERRGKSEEEIKKQTDYYFVHSMEQFYWKHYLGKYPRFVSELIFAVIRVKKRLI